MLKKSLLACALIGVSLIAVAHDAVPQPKSTDLIRWRQSAYQVLGWNMTRLKSNVEGQYNKDEVSKAANTIAAIANSGMGALYAPGSETGKGWHDTHAKPELFKDGKRVGELAGNFNKEANELVKVVASGNEAAVKEQFGKLGKTCKACHDEFKMKD